MSKVTALLLCIGTASAQDVEKGTTLYEKGGADWDKWTYTVQETTTADDGTETTETNTYYATNCVELNHQSPISLPTSKSQTNGGRLQGSYYNSIEVSEATQGSTIASGADFIFDSISQDSVWTWTGGSFTHNTHYHATETFSTTKVRAVWPAEHQIDGETYDLELQIIGDNTSATSASTKHENLVYSVLFKIDDTNAPATVADANALAAENENRWGALLFGALTTGRNGVREGTVASQAIPIGDFWYQNSMEEYWNYDGSLTQIPCTQYADVIVSKKTYTVNSAFVNIYKGWYGADAWNGNADNASQGNNRLTQDFTGKRLIFIKDIAASYLAASFLGVATLVSSFL